MAFVEVKSKSRDQGSTSPQEKVKGKCYKCDMAGHFARDCRKPKKARFAQSKNEHANASCTASNEESQHILFSTSSGIPGDKSFVSTWCIDSSALEHISNDKDMMENYETFLAPEIVRLGDNKEVIAYGKGTIVLKANALGKWKHATLTDVLFIPSLAENLFSVSAATRKGLTI